MQTVLFISIVILCIYIYAYLCRDHRIYNRLVFIAMVAFLIGSCVKSNLITNSQEKQTTVIISNPTSHDVDSAVVWTDATSNEVVMSKEEKSDMITVVANSLKNLSKDVAIEDDS